MPEIQDFKKASASAQGISVNFKMYPCMYYLHGPTRLPTGTHVCVQYEAHRKHQASLLLVDVVFARLIHDSSY